MTMATSLERFLIRTATSTADSMVTMQIMANVGGGTADIHAGSQTSRPVLADSAMSLFLLIGFTLGQLFVVV